MEKWFGFNFSGYPRERRVILRILLGICFVYIAVDCFEKFFIITQLKHQRDFAAYYAAAKAYHQGLPFHNTGSWPLVRDNVLAHIPVFAENDPPPLLLYVYSPFLAWLLIPLSGLPYSLAERIWSYGNILVYFLAVFIFMKTLFEYKILQKWELSWIGLFSLYWAPALFALWGGQITILLFMLLLLHLDLSLKGNDFLAGIILGVAILLKFSPVIFLGLWILQRRWKIVIACILIVFIGSWVSGWKETLFFYSSILPSMLMGENHPANISCWGIYLTGKFGDPWGWLTELQYYEIQYQYVVFRICIAMGWLITLWGMWRNDGAWFLMMSFAMLLCSMLFLSPVTRIYDCIYLFPVLILGYAGYKRFPSYILLSALLFAGLAFAINLGKIVAFLSLYTLPYIVIDKLNVIALGWLWIVFLYFQKKNIIHQEMLEK